jgi:small subunit ribosomal protein S3
VVIGRKGAEIDKIKEELSKMTGKEVYVEIAEIKKPELDAQLVAENICMQLERRVAFRRAIKRSMQVTMDMGALGIRLRVAGRLNGADIARSENAREGEVPLHTLRANIDYGFAEASTQYGVIGVKCWICRKDPAEEENERQQRRPRGEGRDSRPPRRPAAPAQNAN